MTQNHDITITQEVESVGNLNITGNVVPHHWYKAIVHENGKPNHVAILLLSDILYWYRPVVIRDESTGHVIGKKKKFRGQYLQRQTKAYAEMFGLGERQVRDALKFLEDIELIKRHFRDVPIGDDGVLSNRQFIQIISKNIDILQKFHTYGDRTPYPWRSNSIPLEIERQYTNNTQETSQEIEEEDAHTHVDKEQPKKEEPLSADADPTFCLLQGLVGRQRAETLWMQSVRNQYDITDVVKHCLRSDSVKAPEKLIGAAIRDRADYSERLKDQHRSSQRAKQELTPTESPEIKEMPSESPKNVWAADIILRCAEWCESRGYDNMLKTPDGWVETWITKTGQDREEVLAKNRKENEK